MTKRKSAAQAAKVIEKQSRAKNVTARKSKGGELDRRETKAEPGTLKWVSS